MKGYYKKTINMTNAVEPAAPASVWDKGCAGKGEPITKFEIPESLFLRELAEMMKGGCLSG